MNPDSDISNLMAQIGGLRSELADVRADAQNQRERCSRLDRENERHAERAREMEQRIATLADSLATTLAACADLRAERDALLHLALHPTVGTDATDPGPTLVAEMRNSMPLGALLGGDGIFRG